MEKLGLILLTVVAGMCNGFQPPVNAALGRYVGIIEADTLFVTQVTEAALFDGPSPHLIAEATSIAEGDADLHANANSRSPFNDFVHDSVNETLKLGKVCSAFIKKP